MTCFEEPDHRFGKGVIVRIAVAPTDGRCRPRQAVGCSAWTHICVSRSLWWTRSPAAADVTASRVSSTSMRAAHRSRFQTVRPCHGFPAIDDGCETANSAAALACVGSPEPSYFASCAAMASNGDGGIAGLGAPPGLDCELNCAMTTFFAGFTYSVCP